MKNFNCRKRQELLHGSIIYFIFTALFFIFSGLQSSVQAAESGVNSNAAAGPQFPYPKQLENNWPCFRGSNGSGVAPAAFIPVSCFETETGLLWKSPTPADGASSPVVWENNVFITGATSEQSSVFCYNGETGDLRWSSEVTLPGYDRPALTGLHEDTTLAASTPATDGRCVYAVFPTGELAAFDLEGKQVWAKNIWPLENSFGFAASLTLYQNRLIVQLDLGARSKMLALDTLTGKELWSTPRAVHDGWASPVITGYNGQLQLVTCGNPFVTGYDPVSGKELWSIKALEDNVVSTPIVAGNKVIAVSSSVLALDPGSKKIAWQFDEGVPDTTSPVSDGQYIYLLASGGELNCLEARTGKKIWAHEFEGKFSASPVIIGKILFLLSEKGAVYLLATGGEYKELGHGELKDDFVASPAPSGTRLYIRGKTTLFCLGKR